MLNDVCAHVFVSQAKLVQIVIIEEMTERPVSHIMQQPGNSNQAFHAGCRWHTAA